ncbi:MAG: sigma-54-dependent transcriptional regulator, partial [Pyrinomonadaceae bacterium]
MNKRILIVDDEAHIRRMMRLTLETAGYDVGEASDGSQALEKLGNNSSWDVVLLDQKMPGMEGLEVLREIKLRKLDTAVIMVTAFASIELAVEAMKLGATDFVRKPMTPETLRHAVTAALTRVATTTKAQQASSISEEQPHSLIQTITMNGFEISRPFEVSGSKLEEPGERCFLVKNPRGWQREVIVEIPDDVVAYAERMTRRRL